jgi:hypothetical protein
MTKKKKELTEEELLIELAYNYFIIHRKLPHNDASKAEWNNLEENERKMYIDVAKQVEEESEQRLQNKAPG